MKIEFLAAAEQELFDAVDRYDALAGLGLDLISEVRRIAGILSEHQFIGRPLDRAHRSVPLRRFPFSLVYRVSGGAVQIVAVAHRRRQPRYWQPRVHDRLDYGSAYLATSPRPE